MKIMIEIAPGELVDRLSILEIKLSMVIDEAKLTNIRHEHALLARDQAELYSGNSGLEALAAELRAINETIWCIEDDIRDHERRRDFGESFVALARSVYQTNDKRAALKRRINDLLKSGIIEEKNYAPY